MKGGEGLSKCIHVLLVLNIIVKNHGYQIVEEGRVNEKIGNIAEDYNFLNKINEGIELQFSFLSQEERHMLYFNLTEDTGDLYTVGVLDREKVCIQPINCNVMLKIAVRGAKDSFFEKVFVNITIVDINDHAPHFAVPLQSISFPENSQIGTSFTLDGAIDPDSEKYAVKQYTILPPDSPFTSNIRQNLDGSSSVQIVLTEELDREVIDQYNIQVIATDGGSPPKNGTLHVNITVRDVNDEHPIFTHEMYNVSVKEDIDVNSTILQVSANDRDSGDNGKITYGFATHQKQPNVKTLFYINPETGNITTTGRLVYSTDHKYLIIVEAKDNGMIPKVSQAFVYIDIQDVNNNPPKIEINLLSSSNFAKVSELADVDAVVALIGVSDDDVGLNGVTDCTLDSETFGLTKTEENEYSVVVKQPLNREAEGMYTLTIACQDLGTPPFNSSKSFNVSVTDENDHKPEFVPSAQYQASIAEVNNYGDIVLTVKAIDGDIGNNAKITYELQRESWTDFAIDEDQGIIRAIKKFDRETQDLYTFTVLAIDGGDERYTSTATVTVNILDVNDNRPTFPQAYYEFSVPEDAHFDNIIGQVSASDDDIENNAVMTYSIIKRLDDSLPVDIDPHGFLRVKSTLDRELHTRYDFTVMATDQGSPYRLNSSVNVSVKITDVNDNTPQLIKPDESERVVYVLVSTPVNKRVFLVQAIDADEENNDNSRLSYEINERNDTYIFDINDSGEVVVARQMEKRDINTYILHVTIFDNGKPRRLIKTSLIMSVMTNNATDPAGSSSDGLQSKNLVIALTVVIVTVVLAATIMVTIFVIRRMDKKKQDFFGTDTNSEGPSEEGVVPSLNLDGHKDYYPSAHNTLQLVPVIQHSGMEKTATLTKDYVYKPRMNTPTPSVSDQPRTSEMQLDDTDIPANDTSTPRLNRLASLRLQQTLSQSHDKGWTNHNDSDQSNEMYMPRPEDSHSQLSEDGDSGRGGSVSDGHMGVSQDGEDMRILQFQNLIKQNGRRGTPPHIPPRPNEDRYLNQSTKSNLTPRDKVNQSSSNIPIDQSQTDVINSNVKPVHYLQSHSNNDLFYASEKDKMPNVQKCQSYQESHPQKTVTFSNHFPKAKSGPGIQMGLSSISNHSHSSSRLKPHRQHSFDTYGGNSSHNPNNKPPPSYRECDNNRVNSHYHQPHSRRLDETFESITTNAYDDDDNTTTSGSYTIDNNANDDFVELNVAQLKDIFV